MTDKILLETLQFSTRTANLHPSPIREILAVINRPGMISFAGGLPDADSFPVFSLAEMPQHLFNTGLAKEKLSCVSG
jgi:DNA-binding transcriptional MocR family regulator